MKSLQIKNILIPTDFSKTGLLAVDHAVNMASLCKASLYLLHTVELSKSSFGIYNASIRMPGFPELMKLAVRKLKELADTLQREHGIKVKTIATNGSVVNEVVKAVKQKKIDIVVMGTHGASGFNEYFIGSNAHKTVSVCPCPVITIQARPKKSGFSNIVLPIGDNFNSRQKVNATVALAKKYGSIVHIVGLLEKISSVDPDKFRVKLGSVEKVVKGAGLKYVQQTICSENLTEAAMKYSKKVKADLIVVMSDEESHLGGLLFGAFNKEIVNHSKIPVMSIRPAKLGVHKFNYLPGFR